MAFSIIILGKLAKPSVRKAPEGPFVIFRDIFRRRGSSSHVHDELIIERSKDVPPDVICEQRGNTILGNGISYACGWI